MTDSDRTQREILRTLLADHPRLIGVDELRERISGVVRLDEALRVLVADGVATQLGDRVGASRAAVRSEALLMKT